MNGNLNAKFVKRFGREATIDVEFTQSTDSFNVVALLGPSGCGKTTLLRCLAGLTDPDDGQITFRGQTWFEKNPTGTTRLSPQERDIGFLFQDYALFPHLNVKDNVGFGVRNLSFDIREQRIDEMLSRFDLNGLERRLPQQLSGGQQQRVALARALIRQPKLLLLDEPLSALDSLLREQLRNELRRYLASLGTPTLIVTHDRTEAIALADRVAIMDEGTIRQVGTIHEVFSKPNDPKLARMVGVETVVDGEVVEDVDGLVVVQIANVRLLAVPSSPISRHVHVCIKGEDVALQRTHTGSTSVRNQLSGRVTSLTPEGPLIRIGLDCGFELTSLVTRPACEELKLEIGSTVFALLKAPAIHLIPCVEKR